MAYDTSTGGTGVGIRKEVVDAVVKQVAERSYKFKQVLAVVSTNAYKNVFFREQITVPSGASGNATKGIPRNAAFPQYSIGWDEVSVRVVKHGLEENIPWEETKYNEIDVQARTIIRLTEGVVKSVDDDIWDSLTENRSPTNIQTFSVGTRRWDEASAAIIDDIMKASELIAESFYDTSDLVCFVSPYQKRYIVKFLIDKGSQFPTIASDTVRNGQIGQIGNVSFIESNSVTASFALVVKPKTCATFKQLVPLSSDVYTDPFKSVRIRIVEEGVVELTDPKSCVLITNNQAFSS